MSQGVLRVQSLKIEGRSPEGVVLPPIQDASSTGPVSAGIGRTGYVAADAGFARRPPEQRLDMPAQPLVTRRSRPERETDGKWRFLIIVFGAVVATLFSGHAMLSSFSAGGVNGFEWTAC
jgi:hypothetical protein